MTFALQPFINKVGAAVAAAIVGVTAIVSGINDAVTVPMPWFMWNKRYVTPLYGGCQPSRDFPRLFAHYRAGGSDLEGPVRAAIQLLAEESAAKNK